MLLPATGGAHSPGAAKGNAVQPVPESLRPPDRRRLFRQDQERRLERVVRVRVVEEHAPADTENKRPVPFDQVGKCSLVGMLHKGAKQVAVFSRCDFGRRHDFHSAGPRPFDRHTYSRKLVRRVRGIPRFLQPPAGWLIEPDHLGCLLGVIMTRRSGPDFGGPAIIAPSPWDVPSPVLLNTHKHHAGFLRERIRTAVAAGATGLPTLADELAVVGTKLMDFYHGPFSPREIADRVMARLQASRCDLPAEFRAWLESAGGYQTIEFPEDMSRWV